MSNQLAPIDSSRSIGKNAIYDWHRGILYVKVERKSFSGKDKVRENSNNGSTEKKMP